MKVGVLGGTFDPPHRAHIWIARTVLNRLGLDQVVLMVADHPPHKLQQVQAEGYHRFAMAVLATQDDPQMLVSSMELKVDTVTYTVDTMQALRESQPNQRFCFIAGGDSLSELNTWKEWERLVADNVLVFVPRADGLVGRLAPEIDRLVDRVGLDERIDLTPGRCLLLDSAPTAVSSSSIRRQLLEGLEPSREVLPEAVSRYIRKNHLYEHDSSAG